MTPKRIAIFGIVCICISIASVAISYLPFGGGSIPFVTPVTHPGAWVIVIEQTEDRKDNPDYAAIANNARYWDGLKQRGYQQPRFYDAESDDAKKYASKTTGYKIPVLLLLDKDGSFLWSGEIPLDTGQIDGILKRECGL